MNHLIHRIKDKINSLPWELPVCIIVGCAFGSQVDNPVFCFIFGCICGATAAVWEYINGKSGGL